MQVNVKRILVLAAVAAAVFAVSVGAAMAAGARDGSRHDEGNGRTLLRASLAPSVPTDPAIHGVIPGGLPWVLDRGTVRLQADGHIRVKLDGLVIPVAHGTLPAGTARPVTTVSASLYCAPDASGAAATTKSVAISEDGDAMIEDTVTLPATCFAPIVLVHPNGGAGAYIAVSGWRS